MGTAINPNINGLLAFVLLSTVPFNLLKGVLVSLIVFISYKRYRQCRFQRIYLWIFLVIQKNLQIDYIEFFSFLEKYQNDFYQIIENEVIL